MILWLFYERTMGVTVRLGQFFMENPEIRNPQPEMKMEMETEPELEQ